MSDQPTSAAPKQRTADSLTPITDAIYGKKTRRAQPGKPVREGTGFRTFGVGAQLRQKLGGRAYGQLLDRLNRVTK